MRLLEPKTGPTTFGFKDAAFPVTMEFVALSVPELLKMPPPLSLALLPETVVLCRVSVLEKQ